MKRREFRFARLDMGGAPQNPRHCFAANFALSFYRRRAIYSFIPKNACSTMRFTLAVDNGFLRKNDNVQWIHANNGTFVARQDELVTADFTFTILRCPFDRLASAYLDKIVGMHRDAWDFREEGHHMGGALDASFSDFVTAIAGPEQKNRNIHWRPQTDFMLYKDYDRFYSFADMPGMATDLKTRIGLDIVDVRKRTNHGRHDLTLIEGDFSSTPAHRIADMKRDGQCPSTRSLYTPATIRMVEKYYRGDIRLYISRTKMPCTVIG